MQVGNEFFQIYYQKIHFFFKQSLRRSNFYKIWNRYLNILPADYNYKFIFSGLSSYANFFPPKNLSHFFRFYNHIVNNVKYSFSFTHSKIFYVSLHFIIYSLILFMQQCEVYFLNLVFYDASILIITETFWTKIIILFNLWHTYLSWDLKERSK